MDNQSITKFEVNYNGSAFLLDVAEGKMMSLNAIYVAAGSPANKDPRQWARLPATQQLVDSVAENLNLAQNVLLKSKRGKGGGTWAHKDIALTYLEYLKKGIIKKHKQVGLYALMFSNGIIKVGKSTRGSIRVNEHESNAKAYGLVIIDRYLVEDTEITENELLAFCKGLASQTDDGFNHHGEYFVGINFEKIKNFLGYTKKIKTENINGNRLCAIACYQSAEKVASVI